MHSLIFNNHSFYKLQKKFINVTAVLTIALGLSVVYGWLFTTTYLIQYKAGTVAMVFNSALSFILLSLGIISAKHQWHWSSNIFASIVFVLCSIVILQYFFTISLGIDELFINHYHHEANPFPGRMSANAAFCFILAAVALSLLSFRQIKRQQVVVAGTLAILILCLSILFVSGYISDISHIYQWGQSTPIALNTAIGFILLALGLIALTFLRAAEYKMKVLKALPFVTALCIILAVILLSAAIYEHQLTVGLITALPIVTLAAGIIFAMTFGLLLSFAQNMFSSAFAAKKALSLVRATLDSTADGILVVNREGKFVDCNAQFLEMWDVRGGKQSLKNIPSISGWISNKLTQKERFLVKVERIERHPSQAFVDEIRLINGSVFEQSTQPQFLEENIIGRVWCYRDVTLQKRLEDQLTRHATHDSLTGLPNRALLLDLIEHSINAAKNNNKMVALFLINIDRFSIINDAFGRMKGDEFLKIVSVRLKGLVADGHILGRIAGDEFLMINNNLNKIEDSVWMIKKLMHSLGEPFYFYKNEINISCSIGISCYPRDGKDIDTLLTNADIAMSRVKKKGRNAFQYYTPDMNTYTLDHLKLENDIRHALTNREFCLYYQPIIDLKNMKLISLEALIRWNHPKRGMIMPLDFIPLAEDMGFIREIGEWVIQTACYQLKAWHEAGFEQLKVAVNVSSVQFKSDKLLKIIANTLEYIDLSPEFIELEITESVLLEGSEEVKQTLNALKSMNLKISIDDFGTRYSCLSYLKRFDIDKLKIDKSFIQDLPKNAEDQTLVRTIIGMAKSLNVQVLAEGIENRSQLKLLTDLNCDAGQGYLFSKPMPVYACVPFFKNYEKQLKYLR